MTRFRFFVPFAACALFSVQPAHADNAKDAKKELAFGIDVARRGLWQEARFRFEQATTINPESASAFNNLGVTLEQQGEFEKARAAYDRALGNSVFFERGWHATSPTASSRSSASTSFHSTTRVVSTSATGGPTLPSREMTEVPASVANVSSTVPW